MLKAISVETGLDDIKNHLNNCGYQVVDMAESFRPIEAVIFTGEYMNGTCAERARMPKSTMIINALGMDGEQIVAHLESKS